MLNRTWSKRKFKGCKENNRLQRAVDTIWSGKAWLNAHSFSLKFISAFAGTLEEVHGYQYNVSSKFKAITPVYMASQMIPRFWAQPKETSWTLGIDFPAKYFGLEHYPPSKLKFNAPHRSFSIKMPEPSLSREVHLTDIASQLSTVPNHSVTFNTIKKALNIIDTLSGLHEELPASFFVQGLFHGLSLWSSVVTINDFYIEGDNKGISVLADIAAGVTIGVYRVQGKSHFFTYPKKTQVFTEICRSILV